MLQWEPAINGSVYRVKHYLQNLDGEGYTEFETEELPGTAEETATAEPKEYEGFTFNEDVEGTVISDIIKGDSTTVLKLYYDRDKYNVTYDGNGGTTSVADENSPYYHGTTVTVKDQGDTAKEGYTFVNWNTDPEGNGITYNGEGTATFVIEKDTTLYAQYRPNTDTLYRVEYYLENLEKTGFDIDESAGYTDAGTTDTEATAELKTFPGFTLDETVSGSMLSGIIAGDGSLVLKVYYTRNTDTKYKVEYYLQNVDGTDYEINNEATENLEGITGATATAEEKTFEHFELNKGAEGTLETSEIAPDGSTVLKLYYDRNRYNVIYDGNGGTTTVADENSPYYYGSTVTVKDKGDTAKVGYTFTEWNTEPDGSGTTYGGEGTSTFVIEGDTTIYAQYTPNTDTAYRVEYYLENLEKTGFDIDESAGYTDAGTTDTEATAEIKTFPGFTLDETVSGSMLSGIIAGDGSLVLKVYYTRNTDTKYKVEYYLQNVDGTDYEINDEATENLEGITGATVTAEEKTFEHFELNKDVEGTLASAEIAPDGTTVLKLYYDRNKYNVIYDGNGGTTTVADENSPYYYGSTVTVKDKGDTAKVGYTFTEWNTEPDGSGTTYGGEGTSTFVIEKDTTLYAQYSPNTDTRYRVEYYLQNVDGTDYEINNEATENLEGMAGATVTAEEKTFEHFELNKDVEGTLASAEIAPDGTTVLKLYYDRNKYNVIYDGNGGTTTVTDENSPYYYGSTVTVKDKGNTERSGYNFLYWNTEPDGSGITYTVSDVNTFTITEDTTLYAQWRNRSGGGGGGGTSFSTTTATPAPSAETESPETPVTEKNEFDIRITKQLADGQKRVVMPGETVKYTVTVTNNGTNTIHNVVVYDEMGTEGGVIDTIESLAPGESKTYELEITVSAAAKQNDVIEGSATANSNETGEVQGEAGVVVTVGQTTVPELLTTDHVWYLRGYPDNSIRPEGNITRAEVTMAFYRLLNDRKDIEDFDKSDLQRCGYE